MVLRWPDPRLSPKKSETTQNKGIDVKAILFALAAVALMFDISSASAQGCMQSNAGEQIAEGRLALGTFRDAADRPETAYILTLAVPTCLNASDPDDRVASAKTIHIYSSKDAVHATIKRFVGKTVLVRGQPFGAHTAHHHAPIVMDISEIDQQ